MSNRDNAIYRKNQCIRSSNVLKTVEQQVDIQERLVIHKVVDLEQEQKSLLSLVVASGVLAPLLGAVACTGIFIAKPVVCILGIFGVFANGISFFDKWKRLRECRKQIKKGRKIIYSAMGVLFSCKNNLRYLDRQIDLIDKLLADKTLSDEQVGQKLAEITKPRAMKFVSPDIVNFSDQVAEEGVDKKIYENLFENFV